jgi:hypothetical protein
MTKKILILQPEFTRRYPSAARLRVNNAAMCVLGGAARRSAIGGKITQRLFEPRKIGITMEFLFYGELPNILGAENVYAIDRYHPCYSAERLDSYRYLDWQNYPSNFGYPLPTFISLAQAESMLTRFDSLIASFYCGTDARRLLRLAKKAGVQVAIVDCIDHESVYFNRDVDPFRGFKTDEFDLYFKKDIPVWAEDPRLLPLSPIPVKPDSEIIDNADWSRRENDLFFVGVYRAGVTRHDRLQLCELLRNSFPRAKILLNAQPISHEEHLRQIRNSRILVSPSGRVWDSYRHVQYALNALPLILPEPDCKTLPPTYIDGQNAILYRTIKRDGRVLLDGQDELVNKIRYYLNSEIESMKLGRNLRRDVLAGHTTTHRANYILERLTRSSQVPASA